MGTEVGETWLLPCKIWDSRSGVAELSQLLGGWCHWDYSSWHFEGWMVLQNAVNYTSNDKASHTTRLWPLWQQSHTHKSLMHGENDRTCGLPHWASSFSGLHQPFWSAYHYQMLSSTVLWTEQPTSWTGYMKVHQYLTRNGDAIKTYDLISLSLVKSVSWF